MPTVSRFKDGGAEDKRYPKDIMLFLYDPRKSFVHVLVRLRNSPGAIGDVATRVNRAGLNILTGFTSVVPGEEIGIWSFFAERIDGGDKDEIERVLASSPYVTGVSLNESSEGLLVDGMHFPLRMTPGREVVGFNRENLKSMFNRVITTFGTGGVVILQQEGKEIGRQGGAYLRQVLGTDTLRRQIALVGDLLSGWGWGHVESMHAEKDFSEVKLRVADCFEAKGERSVRPMCNFVRGMLAGFFQEVAGSPMEATEEECVAQGAPFCEFALTRR